MVVVAIHVLYYLLLTTIPALHHPDPTPDEEVVLVLLPPEPTPIQTVHVASKSHTPKPSFQSRPAVTIRDSQDSPTARESQPVGPTQSDERLNLHMPQPTHAGITFEQDFRSKGRRRPLAATRPEYFRMRDPITPEDVVKGTAQILGLWPPGYTTDPCPEIRESIEELMADTSANGRRLLDLELSLQRDYCN